MADTEPDFTEITISHPSEPEQRQVAKHAFDAGFWPGWERVDSQGRRVGRPSTSTSDKKEN